MEQRVGGGEAALQGGVELMGTLPHSSPRFLLLLFFASFSLFLSSTPPFSPPLPSFLLSVFIYLGREDRIYFFSHFFRRIGNCDE